MTLPFTELQIYSFFFALLRVASVLFFLPLFGERNIPAVIKILFSLALTFIVFPLLWAQGVRIDEKIFDSPLKLTFTMGSEVLFGMMVGFVARWVFEAVQTAGFLIGSSMGFSIASVFDPHSESNVVPIAELQYILAAFLLLGLDGHHLYLMTLLHSFKTLPLGEISIFANSDSVIQYLIQMSAEVLSLGLKLSAPVLIVILLSNLGFSILARAVSQMNVLVITFTANLAIGIIVLFVSLPGFMNLVDLAFDSYTPEIMRFMRLLHG